MALELSETEIRKFTLQDAMHELCKYCAPLLFINSLALFGVADLPRAEALNGTLTLVTFEGKTYAISLLSQRLCVEGAQQQRSRAPWFHRRRGGAEWRPQSDANCSPVKFPDGSGKIQGTTRTRGVFAASAAPKVRVAADILLQIPYSME